MRGMDLKVDNIYIVGVGLLHYVKIIIFYQLKLLGQVVVHHYLC